MLYLTVNKSTDYVRVINFKINGNLDFLSDKGIGTANLFSVQAGEMVDFRYGVKGGPLTIETVMGATAVFGVRHPVKKKLDISNFNWVIVEFTNGSSIFFDNLESAHYHLGAAYVNQVGRFFGAYHQEYVSRLNQIVPVLEPASLPSFYIHNVDPYTGLRLTREFVYLMHSDVLGIFGNNPIIYGGLETYLQVQFGFALFQANLIADSHILEACQLDTLSIMSVLAVSIFAPTEIFAIQGQVYLHDLFQSVVDNNLIRLGDHPIDSGRVINYVLDINNEFTPLPVEGFGVPLGDTLHLSPEFTSYFLDEVRLIGYGVIEAEVQAEVQGTDEGVAGGFDSSSNSTDSDWDSDSEFDSSAKSNSNGGHSDPSKAGFPIYPCIFGILLVGLVLKAFFFSS